ncbi:WLM domain-containing protein [Mycotypha africana]|uniref:WLM domain-containing protein n=1 Tax=Mycotypha africana TaxID=64632 RepID=UPI0023016C55|nr:WLM domain-containing protein [Mycotypha africana]KAI8979746.1 WLM domain-containing protein [Mycotypha africana]
MGSLPAQIEKVTEMDIKVEERRKIAATVRMKKNGVYRGGAKSNLDSNYTFHKLTVIEEFPKPEQAKKLLEKLRDDRGIRAIMSARKWTVHELTELTPFESSILGYNKNKGQSIAIRLRTDDLSGFRHYDSVRKVLLHELSHNVYSEHDHNFHALNRQLNKDVVNLDWTANGGHVLSRENFYSPDDAEDDMIDNGVTYEAGAYKLGAETSTKTPQDQLSTPEDKRARLAAAAMSRLTKQEEQEMDEGCGSAK